jgi:hypothetical protein
MNVRRLPATAALLMVMTALLTLPAVAGARTAHCGCSPAGDRSRHSFTLAVIPDTQNYLD